MAYTKLNKMLTELRGMIIKPANVASERRLNDKDSATYDKYTPTNWFQRLPIIPDQETPPESGYGYTQSPYISQWSKMWGVSPITDLPKYRLMYRTVPVVKKAIDKTVATAISKGFMLELDPGVDNREEILEYLQSWINQQENFKLTLQMIASDALTYGNAFAEIVYDEKSVTEEFSNDMEFHRVEIPDPHEDYKIGEHGVPYLPTVNYNGNGRYLQVASKGNPVWVKPLDPLWMRVRRDSYGNVYGYLQYLSTPPVAFTTSKILHIRFNPKSWWTENAYGCIWENELVYTPSGLKRVLDISEGDSIYTYDNGNIVETNVEKLIDNGIQDSYEVQTRHKTLIATDIHPFLMETGIWKQLKDIVVGDKIITVRNSNNSIKEIELEIPEVISRRSENLKNDIILPTHVTKDFARLWGFMLGDGWISNHGNDNQLRFAKSIDEKQNDRYVELIKQIFNLKMKCYDSVYHQYIGTSKEVCEFMVLNGWVCGASRKVIPNWILESSDEIKLEFLEGFIDADGYRYKNGNRVDIEIVNEPLLKDLKLIVDSLGFKSGQVRLKSRSAQDKYIGDRKIKTISPSFIFTFTYNKFKESNLIIESVKSISYAGKRHVYDIAVKGDSHNFIVNGMIAHNTSMLLSLIRTQEAIWTIENDLILISHACAKPPLVFSCGTDEEPWTEGQLTSFVSSTSSRGPGGDIYHRGDVGATPLPFPASSLAPLIAHLDIHMDQRMISLGVPPDLLGLHAGSNRSTATVTFDDWINTVQLLQQQIGDAIQEQLFRMIIENQFGEGTPVPKMVWNQIYEKDDSAEVQKILSLRMGNIITTNEARAMLGEVGHKLEPVTSGDSLLPPAAFMPQPGEQKKDNEMPSEDSILGDDEPVKKEASFKAEWTLKHTPKRIRVRPTKRSLSDKSQQLSKIKEGLSMPLKGEEEEFEDIKIKEPFVFMPKKDEYVELDQPTPLIAASPQGYAEPGTPSGTGQVHKPKNFPIEAEMGKTTGQGEEPVKDLTNVKIKKMGSSEGVDVWLVSGNKVAARYSDQWKHDDSTDDHNYIGGHHFVFDYIPENEIWVSDQDTDPQKTALHEFVERKCMQEDGMNYALAHQEALKAEGNIPEAELQKKLYITPETVKEKLTTIYPKLKEQENIWKVGKKLIVFDDVVGIMYLKDGDKITDQQLVRSTEDIEKFVTKYKADKVGGEVTKTVVGKKKNIMRGEK